VDKLVLPTSITATDIISHLKHQLLLTFLSLPFYVFKHISTYSKSKFSPNATNLLSIINVATCFNS